MKLKKVIVYVLIAIVIICLFAARIIISKRGFYRAADKPTATGETAADTPATAGVISWEDADQYYGKIMSVEGTVVATHNTGKVCFLNFHKNWKRYFTAVIFESDFEKFQAPPDEYYLFKKVRVRGLIKEYKGKPEIIVNHPSQIEII
jgi:hypothetical protein